MVRPQPRRQQRIAHEGTVKVSVETQANLKDLSDEELGQLEQLLGKIHTQSGV